LVGRCGNSHHATPLRLTVEDPDIVEAWHPREIADHGGETAQMCPSSLLIGSDRYCTRCRAACLASFRNVGALVVDNAARCSFALPQLRTLLNGDRWPRGQRCGLRYDLDRASFATCRHPRRPRELLSNETAPLLAFGGNDWPER